MFITVDDSRFPDLIPFIRPGDHAEVIIPNYKMRISLIITEITESGISGTLDTRSNFTFQRYYGSIHLKERGHEIYFAPWAQVERLFLRE